MSADAGAAHGRRRHEEIAEHLELLIVRGELRPDDALPSERELMTRFGAARSSVREALFLLRRKGLAEMRAGARTRVTRPSAERLIGDLSGAAQLLARRPGGARSLQQARALLEIGLAREAARGATPEAVARLGEALEDNRRAGDLDEFERTDLAFHRRLAEASGNDVFVALTDAFGDWLAEQRWISARSGVSFETVVAEHEAILEAIRAGDPAAAQDAMQAHLDAVVERYWAALR